MKLKMIDSDKSGRVYVRFECDKCHQIHTYLSSKAGDQSLFKIMKKGFITTCQNRKKSIYISKKLLQNFLTKNQFDDLRQEIQKKIRPPPKLEKLERLENSQNPEPESRDNKGEISEDFRVKTEQDSQIFSQTRIRPKSGQTDHPLSLASETRKKTRLEKAKAQPSSSRASSRASTPSPDEDEFPDEWFDDQTDTNVKSAEIKTQQDPFEFSQPATNFSRGPSTKAQLQGWEIHNIIFKIPLKKYPIGFFDPKKICVMASKSMKGKGKGWLKLFQNFNGHRVEAHIKTKKGDSLILYHKTISNSDMPDIRGSQTRPLAIGVLENLKAEGFDFDMEKLELSIGAHNVIDVTDDPRFKDAKFENKSSDSGTVQIDRSNFRIHVEFQDSRAALEGKIEGITAKFLKSTEAYLGKNFTGDLPDRVIKSTEGYSEIKDTLQNDGNRIDLLEKIVIQLAKVEIALGENTLSTNNLVKTYISHNSPSQTQISPKDLTNKGKKQDYDLFYA